MVIAQFRFNCAAPFRERLAPSEQASGQADGGFNCAAPFRERLAAPHRRPAQCAAYGFNCAAPFRERLATSAWVESPALTASIVPPPFGSG